MDADNLLAEVEKGISSPLEQEYFWLHIRRYRYLLQKIIDLDKSGRFNGKKALDVGCYPFHLGRSLELLGFTVWGISSPHETIAGNPRIRTLNVEKDPFPFEDNFFDLVLFTEVIEHLPRHPLSPLLKCRRVLKPGGTMVITTPNVLNSAKIITLLSGKNIYPDLSVYYDGKIGDNSLYFRHNREYTKAEMEQLIKEAGFEVKESLLFISYTPGRKRKLKDSLPVKTVKLINYLLMLALPRFRDTIYLEAEK